MVTIVDPHIKRDSGYVIHKEATSRGYYIKDKDGKVAELACPCFLIFGKERRRCRKLCRKAVQVFYDGVTMRTVVLAGGKK